MKGKNGQEKEGDGDFAQRGVYTQAILWIYRSYMKDCAMKGDYKYGK
jgi:hypothetical protein